MVAMVCISHRGSKRTVHESCGQRGRAVGLEGPRAPLFSNFSNSFTTVTHPDSKSINSLYVDYLMTVKSIHVSILQKVPSIVTRLLLLMLLLRGVWVACKVSRCVLHWCGEFSFSIVLSISLPHYVLVLVLVLYSPLSMILPS